MPKETNQNIKCRRCLGTGIEPNQSVIGAAIREFRSKHQLTVQEVAVEMGIAPTYLTMLERGYRTWSDELIHKNEEAVANILKSKKGK